MSYNIVIGRSFIRTSSGIIPLVLTGDSSLTNAVSGDVVRSWSIMDQEMINRPAESILEKVRMDVSKYSDPAKSAAFYWRGSFLPMEKLYGWYKRGCDEAHSLEDYLTANPKQTVLICEVAVQFRNTIGAKHFSYRICRTTAELEDWLASAKKEVSAFKLLAVCKSQDAEDAYISLRFPCDRELRPMARSGEQVIAKYGKRSYVKSYITGKELSFTEQQDEAVVFESVQDAVTKLGDEWELRFVKAPRNIGQRNYVLKVISMTGDTYYFHYRERSRIVRTKSVDEAKRFSSVKEVERYVSSLRRAGFSWDYYQAVNTSTGENYEL